ICRKNFYLVIEFQPRVNIRINRRKAIKGFVFATGAAILFPSCLREPGGASVALRNIDVSSEQEALLADIVDSLIPRTETPGGKDLKLHLFVLKMLDDCHVAEDQKDFMTGLALFNESARHHMGERFTAASTPKKESFLIFLENNEDVPKGLRSFYKI